MITDDIIVKFLVGEAEPHEVAMIDQWRKSSVDNEKYLKQFEMVWEKSAGIKNTETVDVDKAWQKVQQKINAGQRKETKVIPIGRKWLAAASIVLILGIGVFMFNRNAQPKETVLTAIVSGDVKNLQLADGSRITIKNGSFSYPEAFKGDKRKVKLMKGKAFFDIASDKEKPFEIEAGNTLITVVGTEFEINTGDEFTQVLVKEGKVKFHTPDGEKYLTAGMGARYSNDRHTLEEAGQNSANTFSYSTGRLDFNNQTLKQVIKDLNEHYRVNLQLENASLENCRITSSFDHDKLETVLNVISLTLDLKAEKVPGTNTIILKGKGCN